jgi:hypothetical protein
MSVEGLYCANGENSPLSNTPVLGGNALDAERARALERAAEVNRPPMSYTFASPDGRTTRVGRGDLEGQRKLLGLGWTNLDAPAVPAAPIVPAAAQSTRPTTEEPPPAQPAPQGQETPVPAAGELTDEVIDRALARLIEHHDVRIASAATRARRYLAEHKAGVYCPPRFKRSL